VPQAEIDDIYLDSPCCLAPDDRSRARRSPRPALQQRIPRLAATSRRRLLGVEPGYGRLLGLDEAWAYEAWAYETLRQVGNYAEVHERNVGARSPLRFARGINALWDDGGVMVPIPLR
jgi:hypothetical protein